MQSQRGFTFWSLLFTVVLVVSGAVLVMKLLPPYMEYFEIKHALTKLAGDGAFDEMSPDDIRSAFDKFTSINNITVISGKDLVIERDDDGRVNVWVEYQVKVPVVANASALLDFRASSFEKGLWVSHAQQP